MVPSRSSQDTAWMDADALPIVVHSLCTTGADQKVFARKVFCMQTSGGADQISKLCPMCMQTVMQSCRPCFCCTSSCRNARVLWASYHVMSAPCGIWQWPRHICQRSLHSSSVSCRYGKAGAMYCMAVLLACCDRCTHKLLLCCVAEHAMPFATGFGREFNTMTSTGPPNT